MKMTKEKNYKMYALFLSVLLLSISITAFTTSKMHQEMDELTVKRINIIEEDGTIRMVISNKQKQHSGRMDGQDLDARDRQAGILFFNDEGDEAGGLIFGVSDENGVSNNSLSLSFDQYKNDQVVQILNNEMIRNGKMQKVRGFIVNDYPEDSRLLHTLEAVKEAEKIEDADERRKRMMEIQQESGPRSLVFLGKSRSGNNGLFLYDADGNPKLMIYVDQEGNPKIQTISEDGKINDAL